MFTDNTRSIFNHVGMNTLHV